MIKPTERERAAANRRYFTEANVLTLKGGRKKRPYQLWDASEGKDRDPAPARGLSILVNPATGTRTYRCVFYFPGSAKPHARKLGRVGEMTLAEARDLTRKARGTARKGEDPNAGDPTRSNAFTVAVEDYIRHEQIGRKTNLSALKTQRVMLYNCAAWENRPVGTIRYEEVERLLQRVRDGDDDHPPRRYMANRLFAHLKAFFSWCQKGKRITASPMTGMSRPWDGAQRRERDWFKKGAGDDAIRSLWRCADQIGGMEGKYLKLMLLTGKRKTALADMRWEHIEPDFFWDPPKSQAKNKRLHGVPLSSLAQRVLHPRQQQGKVFTSIRLQDLQGQIREVSGINDFFWHGLRHLCETKMGELRDHNEHSLILPHIRDLLFDHAPQRGTGKVYDHGDYKPEMRTAMEIWSNYIAGLVQAEGVATLR
jgi:integrase